MKHDLHIVMKNGDVIVFPDIHDVWYDSEDNDLTVLTHEDVGITFDYDLINNWYERVRR